MDIRVNQCNPPKPGVINASSIDIEMINRRLEIDIAGDIVVMVGVNISWHKPVVEFGDLIKYQVWIGLQPLPEDDPNPEGIVNVTAEVNCTL